MVFVNTSLLIWHFHNQIEQLRKKGLVKGSLKFQTEIKFHHTIFGESRSVLFIIAYSFYFLDTLLY